ncbi:MAG: MBL fold metallo-hydrolase [Myxococcota bacterium]
MSDSTRRHGFGRVARIPTPTGFSVGDINSYLVLPPPGSDALVLIDTGVRSEEAWSALSKGMAEFGFGVEEVTLLLLTHAHPDHCGQAARIRERAGCPIWVHEEAHRTLERYAGEPRPGRETAVRWQMARFGVPESLLGQGGGASRLSEITDPPEPDRLLRDGDPIEIPGFDLQVVHTPGHCPEEVVFWQPDRRLMFSGDHLLPDITPVCLLQYPDEPGGERPSSLLEYQRSLDKVEVLPARRAFPSHGEVIDDTRALIASYRLHGAKRQLKLARLLERHGPQTPFELGSRLFARVIEDQLHLVLSEVVGHLDVLEHAGHVVAEREHGDGEVVRYRLESMPEPV